MTGHERVYRALLAAYPRPFRAEYAAEMSRVFRERLRDEPAARVWPAMLADLSRSSLRQRIEVAMAPETGLFRRTVVLLPLGALAAGFLLIGAVSPFLAALVISAGALGALRAAGWLRTPPDGQAWWRWLLAGAALWAGGLAVIAMPRPEALYWLGFALLALAVPALLVGTGLLGGRLIGLARRARSQP